MAGSSSNATGTTHTVLDSNGINMMVELLEKQLQILKSCQIPSIKRSPTQLARKTMIRFSEKPIFELLKFIMQSLESNHNENEVGVISPKEFARINFIEWITEIRLIECHLPSLRNTVMAYAAYYAGRVPFLSCGRPEIFLDQSTYSFRDLKDEQLMHDLANALLRHWPANSIPVLDPSSVDPSESGHWVAKKGIEQDTEKQLGTLLDTCASYIDGHCVLPIIRAESIACLLANRDRSRGESSVFFLGRYCGPWQSSISHNTKRETRHPVNELEGRAHVELRLQLHMRAFTLNKADKLLRKDVSIDCIVCDRLAVSTKIPVAAEDVSWGVMECRWAYDVRCPVPAPQNDEMGFVVLRMVDYNLFLEEEGEQEMNSDLNSDSRWAGILVFQKLLFDGCVEWEGEWRGLLKDLDLFIGFNVNDMSDKQLRHQLMYDDRKLSRSESYFLILQLLRVFEDWITTTNHEIAQIAEECEREISDLGFPDQDVSANWEIILSAQRKRTQSLLAHIGTKTEEIESLRSGVSTFQLRFPKLPS
ncbi:hypothetical protein HYFRA_00012253 [Hymenoscyphus fraxineus]|uniref:Uncharacterized protein n=1 Tax=Hymenoscyphus fraxineus TaxID=746836 RepID=A0A9N9L070_9HELO|nr:hypothetical protein HYFRA_00012253 [Hymenoscyphus fraxineus]